MATIKDLERYLNYEFSSNPYTGQDYKTFQTKYINYLRSLCKQNNWQLVNVGKNHYCFTAFIKNSQEKYVYLSVSDVRFFSNEWYNHVLIRTAANEKDYRGGWNNYITLSDLNTEVASLLSQGE